MPAPEGGIAFRGWLRGGIETFVLSLVGVSNRQGLSASADRSALAATATTATRGGAAFTADLGHMLTVA